MSPRHYSQLRHSTGRRQFITLKKKTTNKILVECFLFNSRMINEVDVTTLLIKWITKTKSKMKKHKIQSRTLTYSHTICVPKVHAWFINRSMNIMVHRLQMFSMYPSSPIRWGQKHPNNLPEKKRRRKIHLLSFKMLSPSSNLNN